MKPMLFFLFVAALGNGCYHLGQKSLDLQGNPMLVLALYYTFALVFALASAPLFGQIRLSDGLFAAANPRVWLVALGTVLIEFGFLMAYRHGGSAQWAGVAVNGTAALLLIPASLWLFHEHFSWQKAVGIVLTLSGIWFLTKK